MVKKIDRSDTITNFLFFFIFFRHEQDKHIIFVKALLSLRIFLQQYLNINTKGRYKSFFIIIRFINYKNGFGNDVGNYI